MSATQVESRENSTLNFRYHKKKLMDIKWPFEATGYEDSDSEKSNWYFNDEADPLTQRRQSQRVSHEELTIPILIVWISSFIELVDHYKLVIKFNR